MSKKRRDRWQDLEALIQQYADAQEADSWKGGGDPDDIPIVEIELTLARAKLNACITALKKGKG